MANKKYTYKILQLKRDEVLARDFLFMKYSRVEKAGGVRLENYQEVYSGTISVNSSWSVPLVLERIYTILNIEHPVDYATRSLSVSDIVSLSFEGEEKGVQGFENYYVDAYGFRKLA